MEGERMPAKGTGMPIMFVHGTSDKMLPYDQGKATWGVQGPSVEGRGVMALVASPFVPGTADSRPWQQVPVFANANDCTGAPKVSKVDGTRITEYSAAQCKAGEIKEYVIAGGNHAWQDWRNEGGWRVVGMPSRNTQFSAEMARFILSHEVKRNLQK
jgi:poly(3-hydroxybutyrate) depolymerase